MLLSNLTSFAATCSALLCLNISVVVTSSKNRAYYIPQSRCGSSGPLSTIDTSEMVEIAALPLLLDAFSQYTRDPSETDQSKHRKGDLHFLASVFANLTTVSPFIIKSIRLTLIDRIATNQSPAGRDFFLTPQPSNPLD